MVTFNKECESVPSTGDAVLAVSRFKRKLGTEMNEIIPFLYLGALRDATDIDQLKKNSIQYIIAVHDLAVNHPVHTHLNVLRIQLSDSPSSDISSHFSTTNQFIHEARLRQASVLVHCLAGVSRSATIVAAYLMTVCDLSFFNAISYISARRVIINPNFGFRMQLCKYAEKSIICERNRLREVFGVGDFNAQWTRDRAATHSKIITQCNTYCLKSLSPTAQAKPTLDSKSSTIYKTNFHLRRSQSSQFTSEKIWPDIENIRFIDD